MKRVTDVTRIAFNRLRVSIHIIVYQALCPFEAKSYNESYNSKKSLRFDLCLDLIHPLNDVLDLRLHPHDRLLD